MLSLLGIKGWGFHFDFGSFMFGLKYAPADECLEIMEDDEDDMFQGSEILFFFIGPFSVLVIF